MKCLGGNNSGGQTGGNTGGQTETGTGGNTGGNADAEAEVQSLRDMNAKIQGMLQSGQLAGIPAIAIQMIFGLNKLKIAADPKFVDIIFPILDKLTILIQQLRNNDAAGANITNIEIKKLLEQLFGGKFLKKKNLIAHVYERSFIKMCSKIQSYYHCS